MCVEERNVLKVLCRGLDTCSYFTDEESFVVKSKHSSLNTSQSPKITRTERKESYLRGEMFVRPHSGYFRVVRSGQHGFHLGGTTLIPDSCPSLRDWRVGVKGP